MPNRLPIRGAALITAAGAALLLAGCSGRDVNTSEAIARAEAAALRAEAAQKKAEAAAASVHNAYAADTAEPRPTEEGQENYTPEPGASDENPGRIRVEN